jgi:serine/threonine protein kinase
MVEAAIIENKDEFDFPGYEKIKIIGAGTFGLVYLAKQHSTG